MSTRVWMFTRVRLFASEQNNESFVDPVVDALLVDRYGMPSTECFCYFLYGTFERCARRSLAIEEECPSCACFQVYICLHMSCCDMASWMVKRLWSVAI